ncbi:MAG: putative POC1 centriolar protein [Streblomastix strix]|uniref:Putative POC1 centriolar protein n=1 Tax=Streblomastix strix TaxID=222440 RepID=A0A5J4VQS0_9EUKA|nr:MAG: putative POC1 centriolar protein [Streblomastix strix]
MQKPALNQFQEDFDLFSLERTFSGHRDAITSLSFSPQLDRIVSGSRDNSVILWHFKYGNPAYRYQGHKKEVTGVKFSPDGQLLASCSADSTIRLWTPTREGKSRSLSAHLDKIRAIDFSFDGNFLLSCSDDRTMKIWDMPQPQFLSTFSGHQNWIRACAFSPDAKLVASGSDDHTVKLWSMVDYTCLRTFLVPAHVITDVVFHPSGKYVAACATNRTIHIWDIRVNQLVQKYHAHSEAINQILFHPSGDFLFSCSDDTKINMWDLEDGKLLASVHAHHKPVGAISLSDTADYMASAGADNLIYIWKTRFGLSKGTDTIGITQNRFESQTEKEIRERYKKKEEEANAADFASKSGTGLLRSLLGFAEAKRILGITTSPSGRLKRDQEMVDKDNNTILKDGDLKKEFEIQNQDEIDKMQKQEIVNDINQSRQQQFEDKNILLNNNSTQLYENTDRQIELKSALRQHSTRSLPNPQKPQYNNQSPPISPRALQQISPSTPQNLQILDRRQESIEERLGSIQKMIGQLSDHLIGAQDVK